MHVETSAMDRRGPKAVVTVEISDASVILALRKEAARRSLPAARLAIDIIETVITDDLTAAVLDR
jgi:hypothetical protein